MFSAATKTDNVSSAANYIEDVFSTYLYTGTGAAQSINNGIGLGNSAANNSSISLNASTPSYLTFSSQVNLSGNFCIQAWVYPTSLTGTRLLFSSTSDNNVQMPRIQENGGIYCYVNGTEITSGATASALQANVWTHLAMTRSGSTFRIFVNGTLYATATYSGTFNIGVLGVFFFNGSLFGTPYAFGGNISNAQIVSGSAIYTTDFTPPQNTLIGGSVLLGAGATPLADTSGTGKTVTQFGSPAASSSGPWSVGGNNGGLVWCKSRTQATSHGLFDTARGVNQRLSSNQTNPSANDTSSLTAFNSNGFSLGSDPAGTCNTNADNYVSWTFRKQAKFFDVVTYTGNNSSQTISHNLGSVPGCIIVKAIGGGAESWFVYHRSLGTSQYLILNLTDAVNSSSGFWGSVTSTSFGTTAALNANGVQYVAYLFAHDAGGFGASGLDNVITCGSYTGTGGANTVTLGYEPQWLLVKKTSVQDSTSFWSINDNMRGGLNANGNASQIKPNSSEAEDNLGGVTTLPAATATGFTIGNAGGYNASGVTYIYIAIRRGPMKTPTSGTSVFSPVLVSQTDIQQTSGGTFPPDFVFMNSTNGTSRVAYVNQIADRLRSLGTPSDTFSTSTDGVTLVTSSNAADDTSNSYIQLKANGIDITRGGGWNANTFGNFIYYLMRRSPGFLDVVCYSGNGTARAITHNLGVAPEFLMVKRRNSSGGSFPDDWTGWTTYATPNQNAYYFGFNIFQPWRTLGDVYWGASQFGTPNMTTTTFSLGTYADVNASNGTYVAYLFATLPGVSKVGTYTGNGSSQTINCGFAAGARFILIKRLDVSGSWYVWDSARGIVAGNDPYFELNSTSVQVNTNDTVDTDSSGFVVNQLVATDLNVNFSPYFFLAIA